MDVYITEKSTGTTLALPLMPEKISRKSAALPQQCEIINIGEVQLPGSPGLLNFSWSGRLPGASRKKTSLVKEHLWKSPGEIERILEHWRQTGARLLLMVTETSINHEVMLTKFDADYSGGNGDVVYSIAFVEARYLVVYTMQEYGKADESIENIARAAPAAASAKTYTVVKGDTLWNIAQRFLGDGAQYMKIYEQNKDVIGSNPRLILPGQVLTLP